MGIDFNDKIYKMDRIKFVKVSMEISSKYNPVSGVWDVMFDKNIIQSIEHPYFCFSTVDLFCAVSKVKDIVDRHPKDYFCSIKIS